MGDPEGVNWKGWLLGTGLPPLRPDKGLEDRTDLKSDSGNLEDLFPDWVQEVSGGTLDIFSPFFGTVKPILIPNTLVVKMVTWGVSSHYHPKNPVDFFFFAVNTQKAVTK